MSWRAAPAQRSSGALEQSERLLGRDQGQRQAVARQGALQTRPRPRHRLSILYLFEQCDLFIDWDLP